MTNDTKCLIFPHLLDFYLLDFMNEYFEFLDGYVKFKKISRGRILSLERKYFQLDLVVLIENFC